MPFLAMPKCFTLLCIIEAVYHFHLMKSNSCEKNQKAQIKKM